MQHYIFLLLLGKYCLPALLFFALLPFPAAAESRTDGPFYSFDQLSADDGLVGGAVQAIVEDRQGFLWFGTQQGLNRYDGYSFKHVDIGAEPQGLSDVNIRALAEDSTGAIWIGTLTGGLNRLDPATGALAHVRPSGGDPLRAPYDSILALADDEQGSLWLATRGGLAHFDPATQHVQHVSIAAASSLAIGDGRLWVGEPGQVTSYTLDGRKLASYALPEANIAALLYDASGRLWVGTSGGLWVLENEQLRRHPSLPPDAAVVSLLDDGAAQLWVGTGGTGLYLLDAGGAIVQQYRHDEDDPHTIASDYVLRLYKSRSGILWAGTWTEGISLLVPRKFPRHFPLALPLAFAAAGSDATWVGTFDDGLWRVGPRGEQLAVYRHDEADPHSLRHDLVFALLPEADGGLWVGTVSGLDYLAPGAERFVHYDDPATSARNVPVRALHRDRQGAIWIGTPRGLKRFDPARGAIEAIPLGGDETASSFQSALVLYGDAEERLWIAGEDGLAFRDPQSGDTRVYDTSNSELCHNFLTAIHPAANGSLWLASWGGGLIHFDPATGKARCYQRGDGLVDNVVLALAQDRQGQLWLSTPRGLSRFAPRTESFETFTTADGLPHNDFAQAAVMQRPDGTLWFGNTRGIVHFQPADLPTNEAAPPVVLTGFYLANQPVVPGPTGPLREAIEHSDAIALSHAQNTVSFEYAALNYLNPDQNQYAYRLVGFDDTWVEAGNRRFATFTNLDPGSYTFQVIASNNDGVWNRQGTAVRLVIAAPWWQSWWAILGYSGLSLLLVGALVELRTRGHRRALARERRLREQMELIDGMKEAERERIARELHDGVAQTLAGLRFRGRVWKALLCQQPEQLAAELDELVAILEESIQDVRRSVYALRPASLEERGLVPALEEAAKSVSQRYQVPVASDLQCVEDALAPGLELNLFRIGGELLSNAARHAQASQIWLVLRRESERIVLQVRDDGRGFDAAPLAEFAANGHFGLRSLRERVALLGGTFALDSQPGRGTCVTVIVPTEEQP